LAIDSPLGQFVEQRRIELGPSRRELSERAEVSYPYISQIETGDREPALKALSKLSRALEVPVEKLAGLLTTDEWPTSMPTSDSMALMSTGSPLTGYGTDESADSRRRDKLLMSLERRLRDVPPLERISLLNELIAQAVQELGESP
jgi:transcriptional regulator with XRE-family HTH domain